MLPPIESAAAQALRIDEYAVPGSGPNGIASGPDGNIWFTDPAQNSIDRFVGGTVTDYPLPDTNLVPSDITKGPDGNLWFLEMNNHTNATTLDVGKISTAGTVTEYPTPAGFTSGIAAGPDGNVWFNERDLFSVAKISPSGVVTSYPVPGPTGGVSTPPAAAFSDPPTPRPNRSPPAPTLGPDAHFCSPEPIGNLGRVAGFQRLYKSTPPLPARPATPFVRPPPPPPVHQ